MTWESPPYLAEVELLPLLPLLYGYNGGDSGSRIVNDVEFVEAKRNPTTAPKGCEPVELASVTHQGCLEHLQSEPRAHVSDVGFYVEKIAAIARSFGFWEVFPGNREGLSFDRSYGNSLGKVASLLLKQERRQQDNRKGFHRLCLLAGSIAQ